MFATLRAIGGSEESVSAADTSTAAIAPAQSQPLFDTLAQTERWRRAGAEAPKTACQEHCNTRAQDWLMRAVESYVETHSKPETRAQHADWTTSREASSSAASSQPGVQIEKDANARAATWVREGLRGLLPWLVSLRTTHFTPTAPPCQADLLSDPTALSECLRTQRAGVTQMDLQPQLARLMLESASTSLMLASTPPCYITSTARRPPKAPSAPAKRHRPTSPVQDEKSAARHVMRTECGDDGCCAEESVVPGVGLSTTTVAVQTRRTASSPPPASLLTGNLKNSFTFPLHNTDPVSRPRSPPPLWPRTSVTVIGDGDFDSATHVPSSRVTEVVGKEPVAAAAMVAGGAIATPAGTCVTGATLCDFFAHTAPPFTTAGRGARPLGDSDEGRQKRVVSRTSRQETGTARRSFFPAPPQTFTQAATSVTRPGAAAPPAISDGFVTAGEQLVADAKAGRAGALASTLVSARSPALGLRRGAGFQPPFHNQSTGCEDTGGITTSINGSGNGIVAGMADTAGLPVNKVLQAASGRKAAAAGDMTEERDGAPDPSEYPASLLLPDGTVPPLLQPLDPKLVTQVALEILEHGAGARHVGWEDIAGLQYAKRSIEEAIVWPLRRPDLFVGLRDPPRGLLLFGPPGTGKTMIARAIANRAQCTFLNISSSSIMSKWVGDGEKLVRCLFAVATVKQPSVVFVDEVDSLLSARGEGEMDAVRRVKTEFLVQLDGVATDRGDRVLLIGATNRPDELDEAARRRMEKRLYIPLPDEPARQELMQRLLCTLEQDSLQAAAQQTLSTPSESSATARRAVHTLTLDDLTQLARLTEGYSGADLKQLCREAAMGPLREMTVRELSQVAVHELRPINLRDFKQALRRIRPSVGAVEVRRYEEWNAQFGSFACSGVNNDEEDDDTCGDAAPHSTAIDTTQKRIA